MGGSVLLLSVGGSVLLLSVRPAVLCSAVLWRAACRMRVTDDVADGELLKSFELSRQKYKKRKEQVGVLLPLGGSD